MNEKLLEYCKQEIDSLLKKKLIRPSKFPWSCVAFYIQNVAEIERNASELVINYKLLNKVLQWIRYSIPNKQYLLKRLHSVVVYSKTDMKSGFWKVQIKEQDRYKTTFTVPFSHYEWNVMPFGVKNAPSGFQNIMNNIFNSHFQFIIVYIDDVLIFSYSFEKYVVHLKKKFKIIKANGMACYAPKMKLFQTKIRFLGHEIYQGKTKPIQRSIEFANKFPDEIKNKKHLQRFLGCLNYVSDYFKDLRTICESLYKRLRKNASA